MAEGIGGLGLSRSQALSDIDSKVDSETTLLSNVIQNVLNVPTAFLQNEKQTIITVAAVSLGVFIPIKIAQLINSLMLVIITTIYIRDTDEKAPALKRRIQEKQEELTNMKKRGCTFEEQKELAMKHEILKLEKILSAGECKLGEERNARRQEMYNIFLSIVSLVVAYGAFWFMVREQ